MEDEDGEGSNVDLWTIHDKLSYKDSSFTSEMLKKTNNTNDYIDGIEENKKETASGDAISNLKVIFKGFKKRILAQTQENQMPEQITQESYQMASTKTVNNKESKNNDGKRGKITEYAQYLGLQPAGKYKCSMCHPTVSFKSPTMLRQHQCVCLGASNSNSNIPGPSEQTSTINSTNTSNTNNFHITRKVYLCSACGTYFENWNLFLHMREIHQRHICLFCLGMFGQAERLSYHLTKKHSVPERRFTTIEDFYSVFKGSCYLICCTCEKVFSEADDFSSHHCSTPNLPTSSEVCSVCRQTDTHLSSCSLNSSSSSSSLERRDKFEMIHNTDNVRTLLPNPANKVAKKLLNAGKTKFKPKDKVLLSSTSSSYQKKLSDVERKINSKVQRYSDSVDRDDEPRNSRSSRDKVAETIMQVSKYGVKVEESRLVPTDNLKERQIVEIDVTKSPPVCERTFHTRYTDTIMQVSRCNADWQTHDETRNDIDDRLNNLDDSLEEGEQGELILDDGRDDSSIESPPSSPIRTISPVNLSPSPPPTSQQDTILNTLEPHEEEIVPPAAVEESPTHSVTRVNSSNRSLVIKICANKNSQFSVQTPNANGTYSTTNNEVNDDEEVESSEENNKSGETDKVASASDQGSDSDSGRLTVALQDSNPEEETTSKQETILDTNEPVEKINDQLEKDEQKAKENIDDNITTDLSINLGEINDKNVFSEPAIDPQPEQENCQVEESKEAEEKSDETPGDNDGITLAATDVPTIDLNVAGTLESMGIDSLLKKCIEAASPTCVYCNHARHIAVHGKQLALHMLSEHRFQPQHPAIIIQREQFILRVKKSLEELESCYFNLDSYDNIRGTYDVPTVRTYECYLCRIYYTIHKELYLHNRKMHQKTILICIMCKSTFYNHSELLCHLCPGVYAPNVNIRYRCCMCTIESLPSAFRLMVHLRKRHHACDVCLESTGNQQKLSNHVWKHKLHHLCYRCGIAYRNKPDITKHLFWKHGTESVLCKKCLQKKWPHIYHFCIPPSAFVCEECGSTFSRAVALKVHKRLHSGDAPYGCPECPERFISKKLAAKHEESHKPQPEIPLVTPDEPKESIVNSESSMNVVTNENFKTDSNVDNNVPKEIPRKVVDVYDLPPLNLSSDSDSDTEEDKLKDKKDEDKSQTQADDVREEENDDDDESKEGKKSLRDCNDELEVNSEQIVEEAVNELNDNTPENDDINEEQKIEEVVIMNGIWNNFKSYKASLECKESFDKIENNTITTEELLKIIIAEHDYCVIYGDESSKEETSKGSLNVEMKEGDDATSMNVTNTSEGDVKKKLKTPKKKRQQGDAAGSSSSSDSSSDSDSSSCSCGTNCSCSTSSSGSSSSSSSSSDSDSSASESSPKKQSTTRKDRRKERDAKRTKMKESTSPAPPISPPAPPTSSTPPVDVQLPEDGVKSSEETPLEATINVNEDVDIKTAPALQIVRESDLETTETETDEDFYDEYPQQHANKLLAEKRNQLMLLAAVAPPTEDSTFGLSSNDIKNGTMELSSSNPEVNNLPATAAVAAVPTTTLPVKQTAKRKVKTKRRKKGEEGGKGRGRGRPPGSSKLQQQQQQHQQQQQQLQPTESIKLNIPKFLYKNKKHNTSSHSVNTTQLNDKLHHSANYQVTHLQNSNAISQSGNSTLPQAVHKTTTNNVNENKRFSKRKRIPKRFYGDSSDEEQQRQPPYHITQKWRRVENQVPVIPYVSSITIKQNFGPPPVAAVVQPKVNSTPPSVPEPTALPAAATAAAAASVSDSEEEQESSSDSSTSDNGQSSPINQTPVPALSHPSPHHHQQQSIPQSENHSGPTGPPVRSTNLYCFCQCPYDEVSEMIACDGDNCRIEWFHFECVGIMVPPKGKWYCPNCRKKDSSLPENEYYE